jgi:hypothetical protein
MSVIPIPRRLRKKDHKFEISLGILEIWQDPVSKKTKLKLKMRFLRIST